MREVEGAGEAAGPGVVVGRGWAEGVEIGLGREVRTLFWVCAASLEAFKVLVFEGLEFGSRERTA